MAPEKSTRRLGRGLEALFNASPSKSETAPVPGDTAFQEITVAQIRSNPFQPRKAFNPGDLRELQNSLQSTGLLQPITVRPGPGTSGGYELIAGERRLRAAINIGWTQIPAVIKDLSDQEILTFALVENLQRTDLNPVEEANGYNQLIKDFGFTQQVVAEMVGKDRSTIANVLRILNLPPAVRKLLQDGDLTQGQARPLLGLEDTAKITALAHEIVAKALSAREVEQRVRESGQSSNATHRGRPRKTDNRPAEIRSLEQDLRKHLQTDVTVSLRSQNRGSITIDFYSPEDLERLTELLGFRRNQ